MVKLLIFNNGLNLNLFNIAKNITNLQYDTN